MGKIKFDRRFIPNFFELVKHITAMLKKDAEIKWTNHARNSFEDIKKAIMEAPTTPRVFTFYLLHIMTQ